MCVAVTCLEAADNLYMVDGIPGTLNGGKMFPGLNQIPPTRKVWGPQPSGYGELWPSLGLGSPQAAVAAVPTVIMYPDRVYPVSGKQAILSAD